MATSGATLPNYLQPVTLTIRWTSTSGELGLPTRTVSLFVDGVKGSEQALIDDVRGGESVMVGGDIGSVITGVYTESKFSDGILCDLEFRRRVLSDAEVRRLQSRIGTLTLPTVV